MVSDDRIFGSVHCHLNACIKSNLCGYFIPQTINLQSSIILSLLIWLVIMQLRNERMGKGKKNQYMKKPTLTVFFAPRLLLLGPHQL